MPRRSGRRKVAVSDDEDNGGGDHRKPATSRANNNEAMEVDEEDAAAVPDAMFSSQIPELSQSILPVKANERSNLRRMNEEAREKAINDLTRLSSLQSPCL